MGNEVLAISDEILEKVAMDLTDAFVYYAEDRNIPVGVLSNRFLKGELKPFVSVVMNSFFKHKKIFTYMTDERTESSVKALQEAWRQLASRLLVNYDNAFVSPSNFLVLRSIITGFFIYDPLQKYKVPITSDRIEDVSTGSSKLEEDSGLVSEEVSNLST